MNTPTKPKITIGCRCQLIKGGEKLWDKYLERECLVTERSGRNVGLLVLKEGRAVKLDKNNPKFECFVAWVPDDNLRLIDRDVYKNIDFIDFVQEHDTDFCPECNTFNENFEEKKRCRKCGYTTTE